MSKRYQCPKCKRRVNDQTVYGGSQTVRVDTVVHHIIPSIWGGEDQPENLIKFCRMCHARIHRFYEEQAVLIALEKSSTFFHECLEKFMKDL